MIIRIVSVKSGAEVSRAELADTGAVSYSGGETASRVVQSWRDANSGTEADAVRALARDGWSNGYLMVDLDTPTT